MKCDPDRDIMRSCKHRGDDCCVSTGICGTITRGMGGVDEFGYFEVPCHKCALRPRNVRIIEEDTDEVQAER